MKILIKFRTVVLILTLFSFSPVISLAQVQPVVSLQTFYDELAPYGQWVDNPVYGYVFIPNAGPGFVPYATEGQWEYTDYGWTWESNYPWGWACFHYGRWNYDQNYGWFWVPDLNWGPAWVAWRNSPQYYGWAPLPSGVDVNVGFGGLSIDANFWNFVPNQYLGDPNVCNYLMPRMNNDLYIGNSAFINRVGYDHDHRYRYFGGPGLDEVNRYHRGGMIHPAMVNEYSDHRHINRPNQIGIYHPDQNQRHGGNPAPGEYIHENQGQHRDEGHRYYNPRQDYHNNRDH